VKALTRLAPLAVLVAAPAAAEAPSPQQIRQFLAEYGTCIAKREPELAHRAVLGEASFRYDSPEGKRLRQRECMDAALLRNSTDGFSGRLRMRLDDDTYRGVVAEALIAKGNVQLDATKLPSLAMLTYEQPWPLRTTDRDGKPIPEERLERARAAIARRTEAVTLGKLGECAVRAAPGSAQAVLATQIDTPAELQALNALGQTLGQCIKAGETVSLDRISVRGALATAYYRLSQAKPSGAIQ
jgi:hypothetical protein